MVSRRLNAGEACTLCDQKNPATNVILIQTGVSWWSHYIIVRGLDSETSNG